MVQFAINQPIKTSEPKIAVEAGLRSGRHRFQLEVFNADGVRSQPDVVTIEVRRLIVGPLDPPNPPVGPIIDPRPPDSPIGPVLGSQRGGARPKKARAPPRSRKKKLRKKKE